MSMSSDIPLFNGGLLEFPPEELVGHYRDLNRLLVSSWHYQGLNSNGYAMMETVEYCFRKGQPVVEYYPLQCTDGSLY